MANVGSLDRLFRMILGTVLVVSPFRAPLAESAANWAFGLSALGLAMIATALVRFCPLYSALGIPTEATRKA